MAKKKIEKEPKQNSNPLRALILLLILFVSFLGFLFLYVFKQDENLIFNPTEPISSTSAKMSAKHLASPTPNPVPAVALSRIPRIQGSFGVPILTYHYITNNPNPADKARDALEVPPDKFEEQMQYLSASGYTPISLDTLFAIFTHQANSPAKPVVLTFDDGYDNFYTIAFPILRRFNFHAVSFIPTGLIGTGYYMNWGQIKEIQSSGLVTFEAHSVTHANLVGLSYADTLKQMADSKSILQSQTGYPVNFMAYPYGSNNGAVQQAAAQSGYIGALGTWYGKADSISMNMPRIKVSGFWSIQEFASRL